MQTQIESEEITKLKAQANYAFEHLRRTEKVLALTLSAIQKGHTARQIERFGDSEWSGLANHASQREFRRVRKPGPSGETQRQIVARLRTHERVRKPVAVVMFG